MEVYRGSLLNGGCLSRYVAVPVLDLAERAQTDIEVSCAYRLEWIWLNWPSSMLYVYLLLLG